MDFNEEIEVPSYFLCPISMDIMKDPVTVCTGITYDRESIEKWVFNNGNTSCPVTKQPLHIVNENTTTTTMAADIFLTPNHTLRRLIQSWCTINACYGVERFPTPKVPVSKAEVRKLIGEAEAHSSSPQRLLKCLEMIKSISAQSSANKRCLETTPGVPEFLARVIVLGEEEDEEGRCGNNSSMRIMGGSRVSDEALDILAHLRIPDNEIVLKKVLNENEGKLVESLVKVMQRSNCDSRGYAVGLLKQLAQIGDPTHLAALKREQFVEIVKVVKDEVSPKATKAALRMLALVCPWGRNKIRVVESGAVSVLIGLLVESNDKRIVEMVLAVLDHLSGCAEGRAEIVGHGAGLAIVSKKILRVSSFATQRGIKILYAVAKYSGSPNVVQEMLQLGVVMKLCLVLQMDCEDKIKEKAKEILKLHARAWRNSPCAPAQIFGST